MENGVHATRSPGRDKEMRAPWSPSSAAERGGGAAEEGQSSQRLHTLVVRREQGGVECSGGTRNSPRVLREKSTVDPPRALAREVR